MRFLLGLVILLVLTPVHAESLKLVTGEYAPYTSEKLPFGGITTQIVTAAFGEMKQEVAVEFIPWNRAMNYLKSGSVSGSFPWAKNAEREKDVLYSDVIHKYRILSFVKKGSGLEKNFNPTGKTLCLPSGWDLTGIEKELTKYKMTLERPVSMESCVLMLALGRVDLVVMNEHVGYDLIKKLYPKKTPVVGLDNAIFGKSLNLYFLVPKKYPNGKKIISDFNRGLELIKKNGKYDKLVNVLAKKGSFTTNCEICNRLGSL